MKVALVQQTSRSTTGTQDFTDASVTGDLKAALFFGTSATANDAAGVAPFMTSIGWTDLANNGSMAIARQNAASGPACGNIPSSTLCYQTLTAGSVLLEGAAYNSTLSNGVRINYTTAGGGVLVNCLLISGSDSAWASSSVSFASTDTTKTVTHGLGGTPDWIIALYVGNTTTSDSLGTSNSAIIGFWERVGGTMSAVSSNQNSGTNPTNPSQIMTTDLGHIIGPVGTDDATLSVSSVGSTTFAVSRTATDSVGAFMVFLCGRAVTGTVATKAFVATTPTSTGNTALVTGMSGAPQLVLMVPTRLTVSGSLQTDDSTGTLGFCCAANKSGTAQGMSVSSTCKAADSGSSVGLASASNTNCLIVLDNAGNESVKASVNTFDSGGMTPNYSAVGASAFKVAGLAIGITAPAGGSGGGMLLLGAG